MHRLGMAVNLALRAASLALLVEALRRPDDPRFRGKAIGTRGLVIVPATLLFPLARRFGRPPGARYPAWTDALYLSLFVFDQAGNHFDWYDRHRHFDLLPHAHGTGAATVALGAIAGLGPRGAIALAQTVHAALEAQEIISDRLFGLRNVRGWWDTAGDLSAGVVGSLAYAPLLDRRPDARAEVSAGR